MSRHGIAQIVFCVDGKEYPFDPVQIGYMQPVNDDEDIGEPGSKMFEVKSVIAAAVEPDRAVRLDERHAIALAGEMIQFSGRCAATSTTCPRFRCGGRSGTAPRSTRPPATTDPPADTAAGRRLGSEEHVIAEARRQTGRVGHVLHLLADEWNNGERARR